MIREIIPGDATLGVVLAGGLARRMGGRDKPLLELRGIAILDRIMHALIPQTTAVLLSANGDEERFGRWNVPVVQDELTGHLGPLAGVLSGMDWAAKHRPDLPWILTVPADSPFLPVDLVMRLHAARLESNLPLACAESAGRAHPPVALWPVTLRTDLRRALLAGERKMDRWTERHGCARALWSIEPFDPFFNINTPSDLIEAEAALRLASPFPTIRSEGSDAK